jgi:hypothetical protein
MVVNKFFISLFQKFSNPLSENLVYNRASSSVDAANNPLIPLKIIVEDHAVPLNPEPVKSIEFSFESSDITALLLQIF